MIHIKRSKYFDKTLKEFVAQHKKAFPKKLFCRLEAVDLIADSLYSAFRALFEVRGEPLFKLDELLDLFFDAEGNRRQADEVVREQINLVKYSILKIATERTEGRALQNWNSHSEN